MNYRVYISLLLVTSPYVTHAQDELTMADLRVCIFKSDDLMQESALGKKIIAELEKIPKTGDKVKWKGFTLEVVDMDGHRIDKVLVKLSEELKLESS